MQGHKKIKILWDQNFLRGAQAPRPPHTLLTRGGLTRAVPPPPIAHSPLWCSRTLMTFMHAFGMPVIYFFLVTPLYVVTHY